MATLLTDIATKQASVLVRQRVEGSKVSGLLRFAYARYTTTAAEVTADTINVVSLPIGARVIPHLCRVTSDGTGGTGAITKIGDAGDDDRYTATSIAVASAINSAVTPAALVGATSYEIASGNETVVATLTLATTLTAAKVIDFHIAYVDRP